jgi:hypothetical protein
VEILLEHRNLCPWEGGKRMVLLDSALVIANYALRDTNPLAVPFITSVDTGGNILWDVSLSSGDLAEPGWEIAEKIASDSPFVYVAGARFRENIPILNSLVHRVDLAGNILWSTGPKPSIWTGCASDVMTDPSGNLVYVGLQYDPLYCTATTYTFHPGTGKEISAGRSHMITATIMIFPYRPVLMSKWISMWGVVVDAHHVQIRYL